MKKNFFLLFFTFNIVICNAQDTIWKYVNFNFEIVDNIEDAVFNTQVYKSKNGYNAIFYYSNNIKAIEGHFADKKLKKRNGVFNFYYNNTGTLMAQGNYDYNIPNGVWQYWYANGQKMDSGRKYYEKKVGRWKYWHNNGVLESNCKYADSFDTPKGVYSAEEKENKPTAIAMYVKYYFPELVKIGLWQTHHNNGTKKDSIFYEEGNEIGLVKSWYKNGILERVGNYTKGKKQGIWNFYYSNGNASTIEKYENNKLKAIQCFDSSGNYQGDFCGVDKPAMFPSGAINFEKYIAKNVVQQKPIIQFSYTTLVKCTFEIDTQGKVKNIQIVNSPSIAFSNLLQEVLYKMPLWEPAISHNRVVDYTINFEVPFSNDIK